MTWLVFVLRVALGGLLIVAGALKVTHPEWLASVIAGFRLLPSPVIVPLAVALPPIELIFGFYLVIGLFTRVSAITVGVMFLAYAAAIASVVVRHIPAGCGCFGPGDAATADWPHVLFDLILAAVAFFVARMAPGALALERRLLRAAAKE